MQNKKAVIMEKLSDDSLENVSGGFLSIAGDAIFIGILEFSAAGLLTIGGILGTIGCSIASAKQFLNSNSASGSGLAAGAVVSAGAAATGTVLMYKFFHGENN